MARHDSTTHRRPQRLGLSIKYPREYDAWKNMRNRCNNPNHPNFKNYGARGIRVCAGWQHSFLRFVISMGRRPDDNLSIDRIDNERGYDCGICDDCRARGAKFNCRWATAKQQGLNRRTTKNPQGVQPKREFRTIEFDGKKLRPCEWAKITGLTRRTITLRIDRLGWSAEMALTTPSLQPGPRNRRKNKEASAQKDTVTT